MGEQPQDGGGPDRLEAAFFDPARGWSVAQRVVEGSSRKGAGARRPGSGLPRRASPSSAWMVGGAILLWSSARGVEAAAFDRARGWGPPEARRAPGPASSDFPDRQLDVGVNDVGQALAPRIAVNGAGQAFAIWVEPAVEGEEIWSARFVP